jgi:hypothetical protein
VYNASLACAAEVIDLPRALLLFDKVREEGLDNGDHLVARDGL